MIEDHVSTSDDAPIQPVVAQSDAAKPDTAERKNDIMEDDHDIVPSLPDADVEAFFTEAPSVSETATSDVADIDFANAGFGDTDAEPTPAQERAKADSIADKLKRIRAVVSQQADTTSTPDYSEDQHAEANAAADVQHEDEKRQDTSSETDGATDASAQRDIVADTLRDIEDALDADDAYEATDVAAYDEGDEDDDVAAILRRLDDAHSAPFEDEDSEETLYLSEEDDDDLGGDILAVIDADEPDEYDEDNLFDVEDTLADLDAFEQDETPVTKAEIPVAQGAEVTPAPRARLEPVLTPAPTTTAPRTRVLKVKRATLDAAIKAGKLEEYDDERDEIAAAPLQNAPRAKTSSLSDEAEEELARELADLEADMKAAHAPLPSYEDEDPDTGDAERHEPASFDADADYGNDASADKTIEDIAPEHNAVEDRSGDDIVNGDDTSHDNILNDEAIEDHAGDNAVEDLIEPAVETTFTGQESDPNNTTADDDLSRLMAETDTQMEEPEAATRRDAFAHLRAAVAAKKADDAAGGSSDKPDSDEAYRDDLANVVRPRRPVASDRARTERPAEARPAPLKLVAEQRIDIAQPRNVQPVRPRRVAALAPQSASDAAIEGASSFTDFANEMGAVKLPDLLEAAAAYLSFVEGHTQFSRPQLMTKVRQVEKENFTREDSLRSFGKLLREGKIEKMEGGRFQASDQIGFKPDARAAG